MRLDKYSVTLTGDSDTETINGGSPVFAKLVKIEIKNSATAQPSDNWDLEVFTGTASGNDDESLFLDGTVSNSKTTKVVYYPVTPAAKAADGSASSLTEVSPIANGVVTVSGTNMGASNTAVVTLIFEAA